MQPRIETAKEKLLVGKSLKMSLAANKSGMLWESFIPKIQDIKNNVTNDKLSLQVYEKDYFDNFNPNKEFIKWALIEVTDFDNVATEVERFVLPSGQYAVFIHKGDTKEFYKTSQYIYSVWLPNSDYTLDHRPHFEVLGEKTKKDDPNSEEEIWIPIKLK